MKIIVCFSLLFVACLATTANAGGLKISDVVSMLVSLIMKKKPAGYDSIPRDAKFRLADNYTMPDKLDYDVRFTTGRFEAYMKVYNPVTEMEEYRWGPVCYGQEHFGFEITPHMACYTLGLDDSVDLKGQEYRIQDGPIMFKQMKCFDWSGMTIHDCAANGNGFYTTCDYGVLELTCQQGCYPGQVKCPAGGCVVEERVCDGQNDCPSGKDEENC